MADLYEARRGFATTRRGRRVTVQPGDIAEAGSWPLESNPDSFQPLEVRFPAPEKSGGGATKPAAKKQ